MWLPMDQGASTKYSFTDDTIKRATPSGTTELNVREHAVFAVALMSTRVFSTAAAAEYSAWDRIEPTLHDMPKIRQILTKRNFRSTRGSWTSCRRRTNPTTLCCGHT